MDDRFIREQRIKARELRKSSWWQNRIANSPPCYYCGVSLNKDQVTMDHVVPVSRGGVSTKSNLVVSCKPCNNEKKARIPSEVLMDSLGFL